MFGIDDLIGAGLKILDKVIPDPQAKAEYQLKLMQLQQAGEFKELEAQLQMAQSQTDINKVEAASPDRFVSGWRPFIGWVCGAAFSMNFVIGPLAEWGSTILGHPLIFPRLQLDEMMPVVLGMLGLGAYRTYEKKNGVA